MSELTKFELKFSYNWNRKLDCDCFTTIRMYNPSKHFAGNLVKITLKDQHVGDGKIEAVSLFTINQLNPFVSFLDTGYSVQQCRDILMKMYKTVDPAKTKFALILVVKEKKKES